MPENQSFLFREGMDALYKCDVAGAISKWNEASDLSAEERKSIVSELCDFYYECLMNGLERFSMEGLDVLAAKIAMTDNIDLPMTIVISISEKLPSFRDSESLINFVLGINRISYCSLCNMTDPKITVERCESLVNTMSDICSISKVLNESIAARTVLWKVADEYRTLYIYLITEIAGALKEGRQPKNDAASYTDAVFALRCAYYATEDMITCSPEERESTDERRKSLISQYTMLLFG